MPRFQITPWRHRADLLALGDRLYHADLEDRQAAVHLISALKRRAPLPHALDSTAHLVDATLHDDPQRASVLAIRNVYCAAFNRFVTGFCDTVQSSFTKMSMYDMAAELDMPTSFVELRHESTHEDLPSLRRLRMVAGQALQWLWHHYWSKLDGPGSIPHVTTGDLRSVTRVHLRRILERFVGVRREEIARDGPKSGVESRSAGHAIKQIVALAAAERKPALVRAEVSSLLLAGRMILCSGPKRGTHGLPDGAYSIWDCLLRLLNPEMRDVETLIEHMFRHMLEPSGIEVKSDYFKATMCSWIIHILTSDAWSASSSHDLREHARPTAMAACLTHLSHYWSRILAKNLLLSGDDAFRDDWLPILEASISRVSSEQPCNNLPSPNTQPDDAILHNATYEHPGGHDSLRNMTVIIDIFLSEHTRSAEHLLADRVRSHSSAWRKWEGEWQPTPIGLIP